MANEGKFPTLHDGEFPKKLESESHEHPGADPRPPDDGGPVTMAAAVIYFGRCNSSTHEQWTGFERDSERDALLECKEHNGQCVDQGAFVVSRP